MRYRRRLELMLARIPVSYSATGVGVGVIAVFAAIAGGQHPSLWVTGIGVALLALAIAAVHFKHPARSAEEDSGGEPSDLTP